jgi:hypothetical protein
MNNNKFFAITAALALSACATTAPMPEPIEPAPATVAEPIESPPVESVIAPEPEPIVVNLSRIEARTPAEVQNYIGEPSFVRRDENVQIMHFQNEWCVTEIIFYEPENGDHFRANHISARTPTGAAADLKDCLHDILAGK